MDFIFSPSLVFFFLFFSFLVDVTRLKNKINQINFGLRIKINRVVYYLRCSVACDSPCICCPHAYQIMRLLVNQLNGPQVTSHDLPRIKDDKLLKKIKGRKIWNDQWHRFTNFFNHHTLYKHIIIFITWLGKKFMSTW